MRLLKLRLKETCTWLHLFRGRRFSNPLCTILEVYMGIVYHHGGFRLYCSSENLFESLAAPSPRRGSLWMFLPRRPPTVTLGKRKYEYRMILGFRMNIFGVRRTSWRLPGSRVRYSFEHPIHSFVHSTPALITLFPAPSAPSRCGFTSHPSCSPAGQN